MNTLLISPSGSDIYAKLNSQLPPLGLGYIAAVIRENGHDVKIIDMGLKGKTLSNDLVNWADVVGISADTTRYPEALKIACEIKKQNKLVVMGGYHVTFLDREALETGLVDFVVRGEGEEIFLNLLNALEDNTDLKQVDGISYLVDGRFQRNKSALPPRNLDKMPFPARDLLNIEEYNNNMNGMRFTNLITSRGCPFNCYFCSSSRFGGLKWRARSAKSIVDEIEYLYYIHDYRAFSIMDDNFTLRPKRIFEFADELERRNLNDIYWWCFSRVDILVKNEAMVKRMAEVGGYMIFLGLESQNEEILDTYNKHIGNDQQAKAIELLTKYGIEIHGSYIIGDIHETEDMINRTIEWARNVNAKTTQFSILTPYPGTALFEDVKRENRFLHRRWELYDALHPVIRLDHLTPKQISNLLVKAYQKVYLNPSRMFKSGAGRTNARSMPEKPVIKKINSFLKAVHFFLTFRRQINRNASKEEKVSEVLNGAC